MMDLRDMLQLYETITKNRIGAPKLKAKLESELRRPDLIDRAGRSQATLEDWSLGWVLTMGKEIAQAGLSAPELVQSLVRRVDSEVGLMQSHSYTDNENDLAKRLNEVARVADGAGVLSGPLRERLDKQLDRVAEELERDQMDVGDLCSLLYYKDSLAYKRLNPQVERKEWWGLVSECYNSVECGTRFEKGEAMFAKYPQVAFWYAVSHLEEDPKLAPAAIKNSIATDPETACRYAGCLKDNGRHWKKGGTAEQSIATSAQWSVRYAEMYGLRFLEGEASIAASPEWSKTYQERQDSGEISRTMVLGANWQ